jgi:hypothetical protein
MALFNVGNGVWMRFNIFPNDVATVAAGRQVNTYDDKTFMWWANNATDAGNVTELNEVSSSYGTFRNFFDSILNQVFAPGNPARNDPEVLRVLTQFAGRPDMSEQELQNLLKGTAYWKGQTQGQMEWNDLPQAERQTRTADTASRMQQAYFNLIGREVTSNASAIIREHLDEVASGKMTFSQWTEQVLKPAAVGIPESPWARQVRGEQETQRGRGVDIENTRANIRTQLAAWGLRWPESAMTTWARLIVEKKHSDDDLLQLIKDQAKKKYAKFTEDTTVDISTQASAWMDTYERVMEEKPTLFTPEVARALQGGLEVWDFEQQLKKSQKWLKTRNAREEMFTLGQEVSSMFGYA